MKTEAPGGPRSGGEAPGGPRFVSLGPSRQKLSRRRARQQSVSLRHPLAPPPRPTLTDRSARLLSPLVNSLRVPGSQFSLAFKEVLCVLESPRHTTVPRKSPLSHWRVWARSGRPPLGPGDAASAHAARQPPRTPAPDPARALLCSRGNPVSGLDRRPHPAEEKPDVHMLAPSEMQIPPYGSQDGTKAALGQAPGAGWRCLSRAQAFQTRR